LIHRSFVAALVLFTTAVIGHAACSVEDEGGGSGGGAAGAQQSGEPCATDDDCAGDDNLCHTAECLAGMCSIVAVPDGPAPGASEDPNRCVNIQCQGGESTEVASDDAEAPDDFNECTLEACVDGKWQSTNVAAGSPCAAGECNDRGQCTGCTVGSDCGTDTFCHTRTCESSICGLDVPEEGTLLPDDDQEVGDCRRRVCDGKGAIVDEHDDDDIPLDDDPCTADVCDDGEASNDLAPIATPCGDGTVCNEDGKCVHCATDDQCTPPDTCGALTDGECGCKPDAKIITCSGHCGTFIGNCGQTEQCPGCSSGWVCTSEGTCCHGKPKSMLCEGIQCGDVLDECGTAVTCDGTCTPPQSCGGAGVPNKCGCTDDGTACSGKNCGTSANNCGQAVVCGPSTCQAPQTCGGGGVANVCGCADDGSACQGKNCGTATNNCGQAVGCGTCQPPTTCGGGGVANVCGCADDGSACQGKECGTVTNNCGQTVTCAPNSCPEGTSCGASQPNHCG
jgi:hypothetical protein